MEFMHINFEDDSLNAVREMHINPIKLFYFSLVMVDIKKII